jgi:hypothetical protein
MSKSLVFIPYLLFIFVCFPVSNLLGQDFVTIKGFAPAYIGQKLEAFEIKDYLSDMENKLSSCEVKADSTFELTFPIKETSKIVLRSRQNKAFLYVDPKGEYTIFLPEKDPYSPVLKSGNLVEVTFKTLPSTDINYKILSFQRWQDEYVSRFYNLKSVKPVEFAQKLDTFKLYVEKAYQNDTNLYFMNFVRFSIAQLDEIEFAASRNRYEKYDFYLKKSPVFYHNDAYMEYVQMFYRNMIPRLSSQTNNQVYQAVLKASPTAVMKALGTEYTLGNVQLRELICIQSLSEQFFKDDFPQTNILTILDSIANRALFKEHRMIARNVIIRLTQLVPGGKVPNFTFTDTAGEIRTNLSFKGKHLYLHFYDPTSVQNKKEIPLLLALYQKYSKSIEFVTLVHNPNNETLNEKLPWPVYYSSQNQDLLKTFQVSVFPHYTLIDGFGYLVSSPALGPTPNAQYENIEKILFSIQKKREEATEER